MTYALCGIIAVLVVVCYAIHRDAQKAQSDMLLRHLAFYTAQAEDIRNLTASIVRSSGGAFVLPASEIRQTDKWFQGKQHITPKT